MTEDQTQSDIRTSPHVIKIVRFHLLNVFCVYLGCMMTDFIAYLTGDITLSQLRAPAIDYLLPCAFLVCVCIGFSLIRHKRVF